MRFSTHTRRLNLCIRFNPCYERTLRFDRRGFLIITERWIIAYGAFASVWM